MITAKQFVLACAEVFPNLDVREVAECFKPGVLPPWSHIHRMAESMAFGLKCDVMQIGKFARLQEIVKQTEAIANGAAA